MSLFTNSQFHIKSDLKDSPFIYVSYDASMPPDEIYLRIDPAIMLIKWSS